MLTLERVFGTIFAAGYLSILPLLAADSPAQGKTVLGITQTKFTIDGNPAFLLGFSYYAGLGASADSIKRDLEDFQSRGLNWLRLWATWDGFDHNISAFDPKGEAREPFLSKLRWLTAECDRRGMVLDITLARRDYKPAETVGGLLPNFAAHRRAVTILCTELKAYRNWYLDLANERDIRDHRYVSDDELKSLRDHARQLDAQRLVTASFGGHDLSTDDIRKGLIEIGLDFLSRHRPRAPDSPAQTVAQSKDCLRKMREIGRLAPVHDQEPFRRGYHEWQPRAADFLMDLSGAVNGGAAGWCFHNGSQRDHPDHQPRRSFDLRAQRLWDSLDSEERQFVNAAASVLAPKR